MIYCVEDDSSIRDLIIYALNNSGFEAVGFNDGESLFKALINKQPKLILLDIMLPKLSGIEILERLRHDALTSKIPVIMLTAKDAEYDKVIALDHGADDYMTKPFSMMELISRIKAVLRRIDDTGSASILTYKQLSLDEGKHEVYINDELINLTNKEFELLQTLMHSVNIVLTRDVLVQKIWDYEFDGETRTVDVHIRSLRKKLGPYSDYIITVHGLGYKLGK